MNEVPQRIDVRDLVREELDQIHHDRDADDDGMVERLKLRGQIHPAVARSEPEDRDSRIQIHACGE